MKYNNYNYNNNNSMFTTMYEYGSRGGSTLAGDKEYVFACRGRPFAALVSAHIPTPYSTLLDYDLIKKLGLKVTDIQCRKFSFAGHKLRILGRVSTAVQCVQHGRICGSFHLKGLVISDLNQTLDTHCVAGTKMRERLEYLSGQTSYDTNQEETGLTSDDTDQEEDWCNYDNHIDTSLDTSSEEDIEVRRARMIPSSPLVMAGQPVLSVTTMSSHLAVSTMSPISSETTMSPLSSVTTMTSSISSTTMSSSSSKMSPGINSAPEYNVPDMDTLYTYEGLDTPSMEEFPAWLDRCLNKQESETLRRSCLDNQPRVVNLGGLDYPDDNADEAMLRVGNWSLLPDPSEHKARHVYFAKTRRAEPDLVCQSCSYFLSHKCDLSYPALTHCSVCCAKTQAANRERDRERARWAQEREKRDT